jgi:hypothetical protein
MRQVSSASLFRAAEEHIHFVADHTIPDWPECARRPQLLASASEDDETQRRSNVRAVHYPGQREQGYHPYRNRHHQIHLELLRQRIQKLRCLERRIRIDGLRRSPVRVHRSWEWQLRKDPIRYRTEHRHL